MSLRNWRRSLSAGFLGAAASQCWFIGFSLTSAANVRTLALIEVPLAQIASRRIFSEGTSRRELAGMAMIVIGVGCLLMLSLR
jgi:drug/metabolite transporter (DMT)-like permease